MAPADRGAREDLAHCGFRLCQRRPPLQAVPAISHGRRGQDPEVAVTAATSRSAPQFPPPCRSTLYGYQRARTRPLHQSGARAGTLRHADHLGTDHELPGGSDAARRREHPPAGLPAPPIPGQDKFIEAAESKPKPPAGRFPCPVVYSTPDGRTVIDPLQVRRWSCARGNAID